MTNEFEEEGLMERPNLKEDEKVSESPRIEENNTKETKIPGRLYVEGNERVGYTEQGRRVVFDSQSPGMIECEMMYLWQYPELRKEIYGEAPKEKPKETPKPREQKENIEGTQETPRARTEISSDVYNLEKVVSKEEKVKDAQRTTKYYQCNGADCQNVFESKEQEEEDAYYCSTCGGENINYIGDNPATFTMLLHERHERSVKAAQKRAESGLEKTVNTTSEEDSGLFDAAKIVASDLGNYVAKTTKAVGKTALKVACKLSYPIMGNLSANLQTRLENLVGKENYDVCDTKDFDAVDVSVLSNFVVYTAGLSYLAYSNFHNEDGALVAGAVGLFTAFLESSIRGNSQKPIASLPGKLVSLPIEGALKLGELTGRAYKGIKNYFHSVGERARARRNIK